MSGLLDKDDSAPRRQKGKNGSGYVVPTDADGTPISVANPLPVSIEGASITVEATIPGTVTVDNDDTAPVPTRGLVKASDGSYIDPDDVAQVLHYTTGVLDYIEVVIGANTYRQTLTYTTGLLTGISQWTKQ